MTDKTPSPSRPSQVARLVPLFAILSLLVVGVFLLRRPAASPRVGPRAKLTIVRVDDEADPLGTERPPPLAGMSISLVREQHSSQGRARRPTTFAQIDIPLGPTQKEATDRASAWLADIQKPAGTRFVLGERFADGDGPPTKLLLRSYLLTGEPAITTLDVEDATVDRQRDTNQPSVRVKLSPEGSKRFGDVTREWQGKRLAILLDDVVRSAPLVMSAIEGGQLSITLRNDVTAEAEAQKLAEALRP